LSGCGLHHQGIDNQIIKSEVKLMKCPLQIFSWLDSETMHHKDRYYFIMGNCVEKECAWWDDKNNCCSKNTKSEINSNVRIEN